MWKLEGPASSDPPTKRIITSRARLSRRGLRILRVRQRRRRDLRDIQEFRRRLRHRTQSVAEHSLTEGARRPDHRRGRGGQLLGALQVHALAGFLAQEHLTAARAAAERALPRAARIHYIAIAPRHRSRLLVDVAIAAQVARV